jgi:hypothetical protein
MEGVKRLLNTKAEVAGDERNGPSALCVSVTSMKRLVLVKSVPSPSLSTFFESACGNVEIRSVDFHISTRRRWGRRHIMMTGPPKASVVTLLFALPFGDRQSPRIM